MKGNKNLQKKLVSSFSQNKNKFVTDEKYYALVIGNNNYEHLEKLDAAENDAVVTTIFVNPLQFAETEDLDTYPTDIEKDTFLASEAGTDLFISRLELFVLVPQHCNDIATTDCHRTPVLIGPL